MIEQGTANKSKNYANKSKKHMLSLKLLCIGLLFSL